MVLFSLALLSLGSLYAGESKVYPTSPLAIVRLNTHNDIYSDIYNDPYTIQFSSWSVLNSSYVWINEGQYVNLYYADLVPGTTNWTINQASMTLEDFSQRMIDDAKQRSINNIAELSGKQYMIYPDTTSCPSNENWIYMAKLVNGKIIATPCVFNP